MTGGPLVWAGVAGALGLLAWVAQARARSAGGRQSAALVAGAAGLALAGAATGVRAELGWAALLVLYAAWVQSTPRGGPAQEEPPAGGPR